MPLTISENDALADVPDRTGAYPDAARVTWWRRHAGAIAAAVIPGILAVTLLSARSSPGAIPVAPSSATKASGASGAATTPPSDVPSARATGSASIVPGPAPRLDAEPTRVAITALGIDLAVIRPSPDERYPLCDVAEFLPSYGLPGLPGVTYLYAHARTGMFLPLLQASRVHGGTAMLGQQVELYSSDGFRRRYEITEIHASVRNLDVVNELAGDALVLQTSETSRSSGTKLVVVARPIGTAVLGSERAARPTARPRVCGS